MKITSRETAKEPEFIDAKARMMQMDIDPDTFAPILSVTVQVPVPHDIAVNMTKLQEFVNLVRHNIKVVR